jgi:hypothetical protein
VGVGVEIDLELRMVVVIQDGTEKIRNGVVAKIGRIVTNSDAVGGSWKRRVGRGGSIAQLPILTGFLEIVGSDVGEIGEATNEGQAMLPGVGRLLFFGKLIGGESLFDLMVFEVDVPERG